MYPGDSNSTADTSARLTMSVRRATRYARTSGWAGEREWGYGSPNALRTAQSG